MRELKSRLADSLFAEIKAALPKPGPGGRYLLAFSGGLDSTVLLHLLTRLRGTYDLQAIHVHHGLQTAADKWPAHCEQACTQWGVTCTVVRVRPEQGPRLSLEAEARRARYRALQSLMQEGDVLLTAHHQDDQAETLLLQLLRGAGPRGLAAMPMVSTFSPGLHVRPLLECTRKEIQQYARDQELTWVEDPSNEDRTHARNFLRQELMPLLRQRWPEAASMLARSARLCADASALLDAQAEEDLEWCLGETPGSLVIPDLLKLDPARRRNLLRAWIGWLDFPLPEAQHLQRLDTELLGAADDATPLLAWPGVELRRYRDHLYVMRPLTPADADWRAAWRLDEPLSLPEGCGWLEAVPGTSTPAMRLPRDDEPVSVRLAGEGERVRLPSRPHRHSLKKLCQDAGVPPWLRRRLPMVYYGDALAAVASLWVCEGYTAVSGEPGWLLRWHGTPPGYPVPKTA